jgi:putative hydrolase of the HAD superfamily
MLYVGADKARRRLDVARKDRGEMSDPQASPKTSQKASASSVNAGTVGEGAAERPDFRHVTTWVFDLDNTLYPAECNLFAQVDEKMGQYIARFLGCDRDEARRVQKSYYHSHGTTLAGLMAEHGMDPAPFLDFVHDIDLDPLDPSPALDRAIGRLPGRKLVYTNGSQGHAENVLGALGLSHHFDEIYDIVAAEYVPKPEEAPYLRLIAKAGFEPGRAAMFEDLARNLRAAHGLGMTTVLLAHDFHPDLADAPWLAQEHAGAAAQPHVDFVTPDLVAFLDSLEVAEA